MSVTATDINSTTLRQIGAGNLLAISGGRYLQLDGYTVQLPVRYGYSVIVRYLPGEDCYIVQRLFRRGARVFFKGSEHPVYFDQVGESAYRASCYTDPFGND